MKSLKLKKIYRLEHSYEPNDILQEKRVHIQVFCTHAAQKNACLYRVMTLTKVRTHFIDFDLIMLFYVDNTFM